MLLKKYDLAIINRSFWPDNQIIGEALLQLGEKISKDSNEIVVITQCKQNLRKIADKHNRGSKLKLFSCRLISDSSSTIFVRLLDAIYFFLWVLVSLLITRPKKIYVSTDPPLIIPFAVFIFSKIFKTSYIYHIQDIHPEATKIVFNFNKKLFLFLRKIDSIVVRNATSIVTLTEIMKQEIINRSQTKSPIYLVNNPTSFFQRSSKSKIRGFIFSGNLGRLQRIPLLIESIVKYRKEGGKLPFTFIGGGLYTKEVSDLSKYNNIQFLGMVSAEKANNLTSQYEWGLLPIDDEVTKYAFPSKTSSYVSCGTKILSICDKQTIVAKWVLENKYGINSHPNVRELVNTFFKIENGLNFKNKIVKSDYFSIKQFVKILSNIVIKTQ